MNDMLCTRLPRTFTFSSNDKPVWLFAGAFLKEFFPSAKEFAIICMISAVIEASINWSPYRRFKHWKRDRGRTHVRISCDVDAADL